MDVYTSYLKAIGLGPGMGVILLAIVAICLDIGAYFWLSGWSDLMGQHAKLSQAAAMNFTGLNETAIPVPEPINQQFYISIFALLSILSGKPIVTLSSSALGSFHCSAFQPYLNP